jgi:alkaline phosphatase D
MPLPSRRTVLGAGAALSGAAVLTARDVRPAHAAGVRTDPFALGVASGDPLPTAVVLWTRLVKDPFDATSMGAKNVEVKYEVATDPRFRRVVRKGEALARARFAHSVHVDVRGLAPDTEYWYRFRARGYVSPSARTRTPPAAGAHPARLRFAIANCQDFQNGYWPAYLGMADEDIDLVLHLGDYIYEYDPSSTFADRRHTTPQTAGLDQLRTLADYRARHAQYKLDPALQAAHAAAPWVVTWDDHEVENNYATLVDEIDDTGAARQDPAAFAAERAAGYQAYWEHLPIRPRAVPGSPDLKLYRGFDYGDLVRFSVLDTRQYRTDQPGGFPNDFGPEAAGLANVAGSLTGAQQEAWLVDRLTSTSARWNVVAQQVMMGRTRFPNPFFPTVPLPFLTNLDQWDGYAAQRARLLGTIAARGVANPVVLGGDIHSTWFNDLVVDPDDPDAPVVASEFVSTSISSDFPAAFDAPIKALLPRDNPRTRYFDGSRRGYLLMDVDRNRWLAQARTVDTIATRTATVTTTASFAVAAGSPGIVPA